MKFTMGKKRKVVSKIKNVPKSGNKKTSEKVGCMLLLWSKKMVGKVRRWRPIDLEHIDLLSEEIDFENESETDTRWGRKLFYNYLKLCTAKIAHDIWHL